MSKQQAILETLLGAAELCGNQSVVRRIHKEIGDLNRDRQIGGHQRLWSAAFESRHEQRNAA